MQARSIREDEYTSNILKRRRPTCLSGLQGQGGKRIGGPFNKNIITISFTIVEKEIDRKRKKSIPGGMPTLQKEKKRTKRGKIEKTSKSIKTSKKF